jgi:hypothetical protein
MEAALAAIKQLRQSGGFTQIFTEGENNYIFGADNIVYGDNNLIIGSDNVVVGDNHILLDNGGTICAWPSDLYAMGGDPNGKTLYFDSSGGALPLAAGDKIVCRTYRDYYDESYTRYLRLEGPLYPATVLSIEGTSVKVDALPLPTETPPPEYTVFDMEDVGVYAVLNAAFKVGGRNGTGAGGEARGRDSFAACGGKTDAAFAAAFNGAAAKAEYAFAANYGAAQAAFAAALNMGEARAGNSCAVNQSHTLGRAIKLGAYDLAQRTLTAASGESVAGLAGGRLTLRLVSGAQCQNQIVTVSAVSGQTIHFAETISAYGALSSEKCAFREGDGYGYSFARGRGVAGGYYAGAGGNYAVAVHEGAEICGKYGASPEAYSLALANGTGHNAHGLAFKALQNGNVSADGTFSSPCADYSEFFEWLDGNPLRAPEKPEDFLGKGATTEGADVLACEDEADRSLWRREDRAGLFVTLEGDKIRLAGEFEDFVLGVVSANPAIIGDGGEMRWNGKYLTDDFGRILYHDVIIPAETDENGAVIKEETVENQPVLNPDWDATQEYIPRSQRPEWAAVGVLGKLRVRDDAPGGERLKPGDFCRPGPGGVAVKSLRNGYKVIQRISEGVVLIWLK